MLKIVQGFYCCLDRVLENYSIKIFIRIRVDSYRTILKTDPSRKEQEILEVAYLTSTTRIIL